MKKHLIFYIIILLLLIVFGFLLFEIEKQNNENESLLFNLIISLQKPSQLILDVPYINEAPDGNFSGNWKNACEEASITMVEKYYLGEKSVSIEEAKSFMQNLFDIQDRLYGSNVNADAVITAEIINNYTSFKAIIKTDPTIEDIKRQIAKNRPVISLHYGFDLHNKNIPFSTTGSYYHMMVVVGYNKETKEFITNDDGDQKYGANHRYDYDLFMNSLHDYVFASNKTNGPARVIFTNSNKN